MYAATDVLPPAETIRAHLSGEGPIRVPLHNLLTTWEMPLDIGTTERQRIVSELAEAGVGIDRPLAELAPDEEIGLFLFAPAPRTPAFPPPTTAFTPQTNGGAPAAVAMVPATRGPRPRWVRRSLIGMTTVLALAATGTAAFFAGQGTRMSDGRVTEKLAEQGSRDARRAKIHEAGAVKAAKTEQRAADRKAFRRRLRKATADARAAGYSSGNAAGYSSGNAAGYSAGSSAGYESGRDTGVQEGINEATDELVCSDDSDVPLPYCN